MTEPKPDRLMNPHLARALLFFCGVGIAGAVVLGLDGWWRWPLALFAVLYGHYLGDIAFRRLATDDEIKADLRERADSID